jgi:hypothetical protein
MDLYNLPDKSQNVQIFTTSGMWHKPRGISMVYIHLVGGGSGGAAGLSGSAGSARNGGGGGASGNTSRLVVPAALISDSLGVTVGAGGNGGTGSGGAGQAGGVTYINSTRGSTSTGVQTLLLATGGPAMAGGTDRTGASGQGANSITNTPPACLGVTLFLGNQGGSAGGINTGAVGTDVTFQVTPTPGSGAYTVLNSGGAGGASTNTSNQNFAGGFVIGNSLVPTINGGTAGGGEGEGGFYSFQPLISTGGAGGGSNGTGTGGKGGNGGPGSGGGGGGAGVTGGNGGRGGDGYAVIICW